MNRISMTHAAGFGTLALVTAAAWFLQISPAMDGQRIAQAQSVQLTKSRQESSDLEGSLRSLQKSLNSAEFSAQHDPHLDPATKLNKRLAQLGEFASKYRLQIDALEPGEEKITPKHGTLEIHLTGRGNYPHLAQFLNNISKHMPDCAVTNLTLAASPDAATPDTSATFALTILWYTADKK